MRTVVLTATLIATLTAGAVHAADTETAPVSKPAESDGAESEPVKCYRMIGLADNEMPIGLAVEVCAATPSAQKTFACFSTAFKHPGDGGLGLTRGLAVDLCRTIPRIR
jgi:hypothetical protein